VAGGRLWLVTAAGARLERFAASAAGLSPRALYVAVGSGRSLVAMSPSGRSAWVQDTRGVVRSIAWAPDGIEIAYVVARPGRGNELRMIEGNGTQDRLLATHVAPVMPSWRSDSLAIAFVDGRGRPTVDDLARGTIRPAAPQRACAGRASAVSFAPRGRSLAFVAGPVLGAVTSEGRASCLRVAAPASFTDVAWTGSQLLVSGGRDGKSSSVLQSWRVGQSLRKLGAGSWAGRLLGVVSRDGGRQPVVFGLPPAGGVQLGLLHGDPAVRGGRLSVRAFWQVSAGAPAHVSWR
jgi:Tol biopolymer transport system component